MTKEPSVAPPSHAPSPRRKAAAVEWPTVALIVTCYAIWGAGLAVAAHSVGLSILLLTLAIAFHASLTHEVVHGHPTRHAWLNTAMVWPVIGLLVPFGRFRDTHLAHHQDATLTDPYEDPETNYLDPALWVRLSPWQRVVLRANNTLLGRIVLGPVVGQILFMAGDWHAIRKGNRAVRGAWVAHLPPLLVVGIIVLLAPVPLWAYAVAVWLGHGLVRIRTFLEHRAHGHAGGRTVVIEDQGPLALLFLNNNFHIVHHMHPAVPWYRLRGLYFSDVERYLRRNHGYRYRSYADIFARYFLRAKDPVPHPLWPQPDGLTEAAPQRASPPAAGRPAPSFVGPLRAEPFAKVLPDPAPPQR